MTRHLTRHCQCCDLPYTVQDVVDLDGDRKRPSTFCSICRAHQGESSDQVARYNSDHAQMFFDALEVARSYAVRAQGEKDMAYEKMRASFSSRDRSVRFLQRIASLHQMKPNGACSCGMMRGCRTAELLGESWPQEMMLRLDKKDEQERIEREMFATDDDWYDSRSLPSRIARDSGDLAG